MNDVSPVVPETSVATEEADRIWEDAAQAGGALLCALEGCGNPLPPPALDEQGRRKGGRPARYCSKAHADAASRARRARDTAAVADPLGEVRSIGMTLLPGVRELLTSLATLQQRFVDAEQQAFAQVTHAEAEAGQAREDADIATARAEQAERQRREALAQARDHLRERDQAMQDAERIKQESDEIRTQAWAAVATHERARGQAEAACAAVTTERDRLAVEFRTVHTQMEHERVEYTKLTDALTIAQAGLDDAYRELVQLRREVARLRAESDQAHQQVSTLQDRLRVEREQARDRETELRLTRERFAEANTRLDALIAANSSSPAQPVSGTPAGPSGGSAARHPVWLGRPTRRPVMQDMT